MPDSVMVELAAILGVPTEGLRTLHLSIERDGEARLEAGFDAVVSGETLRTLGFRIVDRCVVTPQLVRCPWGSVDPDSGAAYGPDDQHLPLTPKERAFLRALAVKPGRIVTGREILASAWGVEYLDDSQYLRMWVSRLRAKLGDSQPWHFIEGVTGGYLLRTA